MDFHICEYGCKQKAQFQLKNGKWCCSEYWVQCPISKYRIGKRSKGKIKSQESKDKIRISLKKGGIRIYNSPQICYNCDKNAKYFFPTTKKYCCSKYTSQCETNKKRQSDHIKTLWKDPNSEHNSKNRNLKRNKALKILWKDPNSIYNSQEYKYSLQKNTKKIFNKKDYQEKHPFFCKIEELREDPKTGNIQVRCKNHNCPNSKEMNGWFTPTKTQIGERIRQLESENGNGGSYLYCSEYCKNTCALFKKSANQIIKQDLKRSKNLPEESVSIPGLDIWRREIFNRNKKEYGQNQCEICGAINNLIGHHIYPQKSYQHMILDPDNGLVVCQKCHFEKCHPKGTLCSTGKLAKLVCEKIYRKNT